MRMGKRLYTPYGGLSHPHRRRLEGHRRRGGPGGGRRVCGQGQDWPGRHGRRRKGPALKTRSITVGTVRAEFESQLTSAGVNQTLHRIWIEVEAPITLLLPGGEVETSLHTQLCVAETVIVGRVPDTYLQLDGVKS